MNALRALPLLLLFTGQVVAGGLGTAEHQCRAKAMRKACKCGHAKKLEAPSSFRAQSCCQNHFTRGELPAGRHENARPTHERVDAAPELPAIAAPRLDLTAAPVRRAHLGRAPEHGPPLYLQLRTLVI